MADSLGYLHRIYPVQRIRSKKGDDEADCLNHGKEEDLFYYNLKQQDTQHLFYKVVSNLVRREFKNVFFFLFNFKLVWFKAVTN